MCYFIGLSFSVGNVDNDSSSKYKLINLRFKLLPLIRNKLPVFYIFNYEITFELQTFYYKNILECIQVHKFH